MLNSQTKQCMCSYISITTIVFCVTGLTTKTAVSLYETWHNSTYEFKKKKFVKLLSFVKHSENIKS